MKVPLQYWFVNNIQRDDLRYKRAPEDQIAFVQDVLVPLFHQSHKKDSLRRAFVISTHTSKSTKLPVYLLERDGLKVILRCNYHDWKVSVISATPIEANFLTLFHTTPPIDPEYTGNELHPVYFEGFPQNLIFGYYEENKCKWSAKIRHEYDVYTMLHILLTSLGFIKPRKWHTRQDHEIAPWYEAQAKPGFHQTT
jgi:hypothetical protein